MAVTPFLWLLRCLEVIASSAMQLELARLRDDVVYEKDQVQRLTRDLQIERNRADIAEHRADLMLQARETDLKLLDHMVVTHGIHSARA